MDHFLLLGLIGGVLMVDDRAGWQSLLAQPIFASLIAGFVFGEVSVALAVGLFLELIWLAVLPMRGMKRPDQVCGSIVGASSACHLIQSMGDPRFAFVISLGVLAGLLSGEFAARASLPLFRMREKRLARVGASDAAQDWQPAGGLFWIHVFATAYTLVVEMAVILFFLALAAVFTKWVSGEAGGFVLRAVERWGLIFPAFGIASLIHVFWHRNLTRFLIMSTLLVLFILWII